MEVRPVDERDVSVEEHRPVFRVHLWSRTVANVHIPPERVGWRNDSYELTRCDVYEAIAWARERTSEEDRYALYVCYRREDGRLTAVWVAGEEPTRMDS